MMLISVFVMVLSFSCVRGHFFSREGPNVPTWNVSRCSNINPHVDSKTIFLSAGGKRRTDKFCMGIRTDVKVSDGIAYEMAYNFNNVKGGSSGNLGHLGFAFNYRDEDNFDFVYKRVHSKTFAYGEVLNGTMQFTSDSGLAGGNPIIVSESWYNLKIEVDEKKYVKLYLNGKKIGSFSAFFPTRGYGGAIVATGYQNDVLFRDYDVSPKMKEL